MRASDEELAALRIVQSVRAAFLEEAMHVDAILLRDGYEHAHFTWVERFSQFTTDALKRREFVRAAEHLNLFSRLLARGDEATTRCIDVAYVESLMGTLKTTNLSKKGGV